MEEEEFQNLLLKELKGINSRLGNLETKMDSLDTKVNGLEAKVDSLDIKVTSLEVKIDGLDTRLGRAEDRQQKRQDILGALLHNQEFAGAVLEQLKITGVSRECIKDLATKDDLKASMQALSNRMFNQEVEVEKLKLVK